MGRNILGKFLSELSEGLLEKIDIIFQRVEYLSDLLLNLLLLEHVISKYEFLSL